MHGKSVLGGPHHEYSLALGSAYTILFFIMTMPLLVAMQWLGVDPTGQRRAAAKRPASRST